MRGLIEQLRLSIEENWDAPEEEHRHIVHLKRSFGRGYHRNPEFHRKMADYHFDQASWHHNHMDPFLRWNEPERYAHHSKSAMRHLTLFAAHHQHADRIESGRPQARA